jgi:antibiotic biosynthesis monooxygenase (ABM) superfamily enzyme
MNDNRRNFSLYLSLPLIMLFTFTAVSKLQDMEGFHKAMLNQPLPEWLAVLLVWAVPLGELLAAALLLYPTLQAWGFLLASLLMGAFTGYALLIILGQFSFIPCSCGGMLESLSWEHHLLMNCLFLIFSLGGLYLALNQKSSSPQP